MREGSVCPSLGTGSREVGGVGETEGAGGGSDGGAEAVRTGNAAGGGVEIGACWT